MISPEPLSYIHSQRAAFVVAKDARDLVEQLYMCSRDQFTGQIDFKIQHIQMKPWNLYYQMGHLVWGTGGTHPIRRWRRQIAQSSSLLETISNSTNKNSSQEWSYNLLVELLAQEKISNKDIEAVAEGLIVEIFFDIHQQWAQYPYSNLQIKLNYVYPKTAHPIVVKVSLDTTWSRALNDWKAWQQAELENYSPNQAPSIWNVRGLQQQVSPNTYQNLARMLDGHQTLRDLATKSNKSLVGITKSFMRYIEQDLIKLVEVGDLQPAVEARASQLRTKTAHQLLPTSSPGSIQSQNSAPLVAHIDDHEEDSQVMNKILNEMGYQYIYLQDSMKVLPFLLDHKPNLIFLDLIMPIINGYEACAQIRRISRFKNTPIIILTSSDGMIDRVRAKIVGSTGFLTKPINSREVQAVLQKYLAASKQ